jgi:hypothetical protein
MAERKICRRPCLARVSTRISGDASIGRRSAHRRQLLSHGPELGRGDKGLLELAAASDTLGRGGSARGANVTHHRAPRRGLRVRRSYVPRRGRGMSGGTLVTRCLVHRGGRRLRRLFVRGGRGVALCCRGRTDNQHEQRPRQKGSYPSHHHQKPPISRAFLLFKIFHLGMCQTRMGYGQSIAPPMGSSELFSLIRL